MVHQLHFLHWSTHNSSTSRNPLNYVFVKRTDYFLLFQSPSVREANFRKYKLIIFNYLLAGSMNVVPHETTLIILSVSNLFLILSPRVEAAHRN